MEFESMEEILPSSGWDQSLMARIAATKTPAGSNIPPVKPALVLLFIILINVGAILTMISSTSRQSFSRSNELKMISKEFLINPTSISE